MLRGMAEPVILPAFDKGDYFGGKWTPPTIRKR
jgi:hypothetical protein